MCEGGRKRGVRTREQERVCVGLERVVSNGIVLCGEGWVKEERG